MSLKILRVQTRSYAKILSYPYNISTQQACHKFINYKGIFEKIDDTNINALIENKKNKLRKVYLPFHTAQFRNVRTRFSGRYGIETSSVNYIYRNGQRVKNTVYTTEWHYITNEVSNPVNYPFGMPELQIYADFKYSKYMVEKAFRVSDFNGLVDLDTNEEVDVHNMNISKALQQMINFVKENEEYRIKNMLNADFVEIKIDLLLDNIDLMSYHMPAYVCYIDDKHQYYKIINGSTGELHGDQILSNTRLALGSFFFGSFLGAFFAPPGYWMFSIAGGFIASFLSVLIHDISDKEMIRNRILELNRDREDNNNYIETDEDKKRKRFIFTADEPSSPNSPNTSRLPEEECRLLGLNPNSDINEKELKTAYLKKVKLYHPDISSLNPKDASEMMTRLKNAHNRLFDIIVNKNK